MFKTYEERIEELEKRVATLEQLARDMQRALDAVRGTAGVGAQVAPSSPDHDPEVVAHLRAGNKISAIKRIREITGLGLRDAKQESERIAAVLGL